MSIDKSRLQGAGDLSPISPESQTDPSSKTQESKESKILQTAVHDREEMEKTPPQSKPASLVVSQNASSTSETTSRVATDTLSPREAAKESDEESVDDDGFGDFDFVAGQEEKLPPKIEDLKDNLFALRNNIKNSAPDKGKPLMEEVDELYEGITADTDENELQSKYDNLQNQFTEIIVEQKTEKIEKKVEELSTKFPENKGLLQKFTAHLTRDELKNESCKPDASFNALEKLFVLYKKFPDQHDLIDKLANSIDSTTFTTTPNLIEHKLEQLNQIIVLMKSPYLPGKMGLELNNCFDEGDIDKLLEFSDKNSLVNYFIANNTLQAGADKSGHNQTFQKLGRFLLHNEYSQTHILVAPRTSSTGSPLTRPHLSKPLRLSTSSGDEVQRRGVKKTAPTTISFQQRTLESTNTLSKLLYLHDNNLLPNDLQESYKNIINGTDFNQLLDTQFSDRISTLFKDEYLKKEEQIISKLFTKLSSSVQTPLKISRSRLADQDAELSPQEKEIKELLQGHTLTSSLLFIPGQALHKIHHIREKSIFGTELVAAKTREAVQLGEGGIKTAKKISDDQVLAAVTTPGVPLTPNSIQAILELHGKEGIMTGHVASWKDIDGNVRQGVVTPLADFLDKMTATSTKEYLPHFLHAAKGVKSMHDAGWAHQDIKGQNIMIIKGQAYLTDLDTALQEKTTEIYGTPTHFSPAKLARYKTKSNEAISPEEQRREDIFNLGVTFYTSYLKKDYAALIALPPGNIPSSAGERKILQLEVDYLSKMKYDDYADQGFPEPSDPNSMEHLIWEMMNPDSTQRPTIDQVIERLNKLV